MKFFHLSDLHFGRQLHGYDLTAEHRNFISQLVGYIEKEKPDAVLVSGDIYDKSVPSAAAMTLLDEFLMALDGVAILIIAGNHDSAERLKYGQSFLEKHNIYISVMPPQCEESRLKKVTFKDEYGDIDIYMLPFIKPGMVRIFMPEEASEGEQAVISKLIERENIDFNHRNVIMSHQFYINGNITPYRCESEQKTIGVGGTDAVDINILKDFDYAALGHIHGAQYVGEEKFRYCGTVLKYSVSEAVHEKSITVVELGSKKDGVHIRTLPVNALRDVKKIEGSLAEVIKASNEESRKDYISITLTDDDIPEQVKELLEAYFSNILEIIIDNKRTRKILDDDIADFKELSPYEAFRAFFIETAGREMDESEDKAIKEIIDEVVY